MALALNWYGIDMVLGYYRCGIVVALVFSALVW